MLRYVGFSALEKDLHQHIHLENNQLFVKAIELENSIVKPEGAMPAAG